MRVIAGQRHRQARKATPHLKGIGTLKLKHPITRQSQAKKKEEKRKRVKSKK
jgi:hypothetical protein